MNNILLATTLVGGQISLIAPLELTEKAKQTPVVGNYTGKRWWEIGVAALLANTYIDFAVNIEGAQGQALRTYIAQVFNKDEIIVFIVTPESTKAVVVNPSGVWELAEVSQWTR